MLINNNAIRKMLIEVDTSKITEEAARKLNKILAICEMELTQDGFYTGTNDNCKIVQSLIIKNSEVFNNLKKWILYNPETGSKEDCIEGYLEYLRKWR